MSASITVTPLAETAILPGDIIISDESVAVSHSAICVGGNSIRDAAGNVLPDNAIAHAISGAPVLGKLEDFGKDKATVYRANPDLSLVDTAMLYRVSQAMAPKVQYGTNYASLVFGSASFGAGAKTWLDDMRNRYINGEFTTKDDQGKMANLVCSQFVVLIVQLALGEAHKSFIKLDARYTLPKTLRTYLMTVGSNWRVVGPFRTRFLTLGDTKM